MDAIKLLNNIEVGIPLIVTTKWQDLISRKVTIYAGTDGMGIYDFIDNDNSYRMTAGYIREHCTIKTTLETDEDICDLTRLIKKVKGGK